MIIGFSQHSSSALTSMKKFWAPQAPYPIDFFSQCLKNVFFFFSKLIILKILILTSKTEKIFNQLSAVASLQ